LQKKSKPLSKSLPFLKKRYHTIFYWHETSVLSAEIKNSDNKKGRAITDPAKFKGF